MDHALNPSREELRQCESYSDIFSDNTSRWVLLPVQFPGLFEFYKRIEGTFWTPDDFAWETAEIHGKAMDLSARIGAAYLIMHGDPEPPEHNPRGLVYFPDVLDLTCELTEVVQSPEARAFLGFQAMFENFHRETLARWLKVLAAPADTVTKQRGSIALKRKFDWLAKHLEGFLGPAKQKVLAGDNPSTLQVGEFCLDPAPMVEVLVALAVFYGLFFSGLRVLAHRSTQSTPVTQSATQLFRDLSLQSYFCAHLYASVENRLDISCLCDLIAQAVGIEYQHLIDLIPEPESSEVQTGLMTFVKNLGHRLLEQMDLQWSHSSEGLEAARKELERQYVRHLPDVKGVVGPAWQIHLDTGSCPRLKYEGRFRIIPAEMKVGGAPQAIGDENFAGTPCKPQLSRFAVDDEEDF